MAIVIWGLDFLFCFDGIVVVVVEQTHCKLLLLSASSFLEEMDP